MIVKCARSLKEYMSHRLKVMNSQTPLLCGGHKSSARILEVTSSKPRRDRTSVQRLQEKAGAVP
jgi:hypothetical protein